MLKYLSKMERTRSLIIVGFAILMAVSLVVFYAPARNNASPSAMNTEVVASVGSDEITMGDLIGSLTAQGGDASMLNPQIAEMLLNQMIRQRIIVQSLIDRPSFVKKRGPFGEEAVLALAKQIEELYPIGRPTMVNIA